MHRLRAGSCLSYTYWSLDSARTSFSSKQEIETPNQRIGRSDKRGAHEILTRAAQFLFTGREYDATFGFYEYRARAYHPKLGRFMSEDPKLFDAGDYNLFRYCHNDPLDRTDPMGLQGNIWWRNMTPELYAQMMGEATRTVLENNPSAGQVVVSFRA